MLRQTRGYALANTGHDRSGPDVAQETYVRHTELAPERFKDFGGRGVLPWSMDRQRIRILFDHESKRLKQVKLSGPRRERVSLDTYANELAAREVEFRQEAKYGKWSEPGSNVLR